MRIAAISTLLSLLILNAAAHAQSTAFTYQGRLKNGSAATSGLHDFRFLLWDAASGGTQIGTTQCSNNVQVTDGVFTTTIDFGQQYATPAARFLEVQVRSDIGQSCADSGGFISLSPRQQFRPAPLANHSLSATSLVAPDGSPANALIVDNDGKIGIGTNTPERSLHIVAPSAALRLQDPANPGNYSILEDWQPTILRLMKFAASPGPALIDFDPMPADGISNAIIRIFRSTNTTGSKAVYFYRGVNANVTDAAIAVGGANSYFQLGGGNFGIGTSNPTNKLSVIGGADVSGSLGIGTSTPGAKLDVRGDIRLGSSGQYRAAAGSDAIRIIRGSIDMNTGVLSGTGFTWTWLDIGKGRINFTTPFTSVPSITATAHRGTPGGGSENSAFVVMVDSKTVNSITVVLRQNTSQWVSHRFDFVVMGQR